MDEVDNIIIHSLRQIGWFVDCFHVTASCRKPLSSPISDCPFSFWFSSNIEPDILSLSSFTPELLVETVSMCLHLIKPSMNVPKKLPPGMAQRFTVTASLAEACTVSSIWFGIMPGRGVLKYWISFPVDWVSGWHWLPDFSLFKCDWSAACFYVPNRETTEGIGENGLSAAFG